MVSVKAMPAHPALVARGPVEGRRATPVSEWSVNLPEVERARVEYDARGGRR